MNDFSNNYTVCKKWTDLVKEKMLKKLREENNLLDLSLNGFKRAEKKRQII